MKCFDIAGLIVDAAATARLIARDRYPDRIKPWRDLVEGLSIAHQIRPIDAAYSMLKDLATAGMLDGSSAMWLMAVVSDMCDEESSENISGA